MSHDDLMKSLKELSCEIRENEHSDSAHIKCAELVVQHPAWCYFSHVEGVTYVIAATLLSYIDFENIIYVSQIYGYCGYSYSSNHDGKGYNSYMKKVLDNLANEFIKNDSEYSLYYWDKVISEVGDENNKKSLKHIDKISRRYMMQRFLRDCYEAVRCTLGLEIKDGCAEKKGKKHYVNNETNWRQFCDLDEHKLQLRHYAYKQVVEVKRSIAKELIDEHNYE